MSPEAMSSCLEAVARRLPSRRPLSVADIGSGTGRFSVPLANRFGGPVYGIEPSTKMRAVATQEAASPHVTYLCGSMEKIPLEPASCDAAFASYVFHHVADKDAACHEVARVVKADGEFLIRTNFIDRFPDLWWYKYFPRAREADMSMYETLDVLLSRFKLHGWKFGFLDEIEYVASPSRRDDFDKLKLRSLSLFEQLTSDEIDEGFSAIETGITYEPHEPVIHRGDLLTMIKSA